MDALTYLSAVALSRIVVPEPGPTPGATARDLVLEIRDGIRWVYRGSGLATLALATHGWFVGNAIVGVVLAPYALDQLGLTPFQLGIVGRSVGSARSSGRRSPPRRACGWGRVARSSPATS